MQAPDWGTPWPGGFGPGEPSLGGCDGRGPGACAPAGPTPGPPPCLAAGPPAGPASLDWPDAPHDDGNPLYASDDFRMYGFKVRQRAR